jgi:hypothetical protein
VDIKEHVIKSCRYLLLPVVRFLLRHGVTWSEFSDLSKDAYVLVARSDYGIQGRPTNNARTAILTGLSRREVARVRDRLVQGGVTAEENQGNRISQILTGWHVDSEFTDENGRPKVLPATGPTGSLPSLLKRYAGDLPHGAVLKEMQKRQLIEELNDGGYRVLRRDYVYSEIEPEVVTRLGIAHHDLRPWPTTHASGRLRTKRSGHWSRNEDSPFSRRWMPGCRATKSKPKMIPTHVPFAWALVSILSMMKATKD